MSCELEKVNRHCAPTTIATGRTSASLAVDLERVPPDGQVDRGPRHGPVEVDPRGEREILHKQVGLNKNKKSPQNSLFYKITVATNLQGQVGLLAGHGAQQLVAVVGAVSLP